jgi:hypothetical protein
VYGIIYFVWEEEGWGNGPILLKSIHNYLTFKPNTFCTVFHLHPYSLAAPLPYLLRRKNPQRQLKPTIKLRNVPYTYEGAVFDILISQDVDQEALDGLYPLR